MGGVASFNSVRNVLAPPPNNSVKRTAFRGRLLRALGVQDETLYVVSYEAEPLPDSESFASCSGAAVNIWVAAATEQEAIAAAALAVQNAGWHITTPVHVRRTVRADYTDAPEGLPYFEQALLDGVVLVFHTWQEGVRH